MGKEELKEEGRILGSSNELFYKAKAMLLGAE